MQIFNLKNSQYGNSHKVPSQLDYKTNLLSTKVFVNWS